MCCMLQVCTAWTCTLPCLRWARTSSRWARCEATLRQLPPPPCYTLTTAWWWRPQRLTAGRVEVHRPRRRQYRPRPADHPQLHIRACTGCRRAARVRRYTTPPQQQPLGWCTTPWLQLLPHTYRTSTPGNQRHQTDWDTACSADCLGPAHVRVTLPSRASARCCAVSCLQGSVAQCKHSHSTNCDRLMTGRRLIVMFVSQPAAILLFVFNPYLTSAEARDDVTGRSCAWRLCGVVSGMDGSATGARPCSDDCVLPATIWWQHHRSQQVDGLDWSLARTSTCVNVQACSRSSV